MWTFIKRYKFSLLVVAVILFLSFFKPPHTELDEITNFDKMVHFGMYFVFSGVIWIEYMHSHAHADWRRLAVGAVVLPVVLSGGIELGQDCLTAYRGGDWWDFASNSTGVLVAAVTGYLFLRRRRG
ncbi:MAG: hypothetical protein K6B45_00465 [Bacteroidaceae bacterium]|nr:hypothetical protein [Bacteroidaceae bacterium]